MGIERECRLWEFDLLICVVFLTHAGFCFFPKKQPAGGGLTEVSKPLGILPSRSAALHQFRTDHFTNSIFIKEPV